MFSGVIQLNNGAHIAAANNSFIQVAGNSFYDGSNYKRVVTGYSSRLTQNDGQLLFSYAGTDAAGTNISYTEGFRFTRNSELLIATTLDAGDYKLQVSGNVYSTGTYTSLAPTDGTAAPWRLGSYVTTAPTATGYVQVEINGVKYKLLAATY